MTKKKWRHPIQYRRDMRRVDELLNQMGVAHEECKKAAAIPDEQRFTKQAAIFDTCSAEIDRLYKKWRIGDLGACQSQL